MSAAPGSVALLLRVEATRVMVHLRRCGVVVHHVAPMPYPANEASGEASVVVFLSPTLDQAAIARRCVLRIPQVNRVTFAGFCPAIMYVYCGVQGRP